MTENYPNRYPSEVAAAMDQRSESEFPWGEAGCNPTSLLDPLETKSTKGSFDSYRGRFLAGKENAMSATREAYLEMWGVEGNGKLDTLDACRKWAKFSWDAISGDVKVMSSCCRQRWCPMCSSQKAKFAKEATTIWLEPMEKPRFLTLTLRHCFDDLATQISFLQDAFRRLKTRAYWKKNVKGGIWYLHCKRSSGDGLWHPHLHILLEGKYMEQSDVSDLWDLVSYGSPIIWITAISDKDDAAKYVARYSSKPAKLEDLNVADRVEIIQALHGKRLCGTFGTAKTVTLTPPKIEDNGDWNDLGIYDEVMCQADRSPIAKAIINAYKNNLPLTIEQYREYTGNTMFRMYGKMKPPKPFQFLLDFYNSS